MKSRPKLKQIFIKMQEITNRQATPQQLEELSEILREREPESEKEHMNIFKNIKANHMMYLSTVAVLSCCFRFVMEDISFNCCGVTFGVGHTDPLAYSSLLAPILAAHGYVKGKSKDLMAKRSRVDNPNA